MLGFGMTYLGCHAGQHEQMTAFCQPSVSANRGYDAAQTLGLDCDVALLSPTTPDNSRQTVATQPNCDYDEPAALFFRTVESPRGPTVGKGSFLAAKEAGSLTYSEMRQGGLNLTDRMSGNQFRKLVDSIKETGLQDKVINSTL